LREREKIEEKRLGQIRRTADGGAATSGIAAIADANAAIGIGSGGCIADSERIAAGASVETCWAAERTSSWHTDGAEWCLWQGGRLSAAEYDMVQDAAH
jgi:hypothetical protein